MPLPVAAADCLDAPVQRLRGIGARRAEQLARLGVETVRDLLYDLPRTYQERPAVQPVAALQPGAPGAVRVRLVDTSVRRGRGGRRDLVARVADASGALEVIWFQQPYLREQLAPGTELLLWGSVGERQPLRMLAPEYEVLAAAGASGAGAACWLPVYRLTEGLSQKQRRRFADRALAEALPELEETLPRALLAAHDLPPLASALRMLHRPGDPGELRRARERLVFDEFLDLMLVLGRWRREQRAAHRGRSMHPGERFGAARRALPFELTRAQRRALETILADLGSPAVMHRLLEGDVGSGKTVVALLAAAAAADSGCQTALMAPTEILCAQHARSARALLPGLRIGVLGGADPAARRVTLDRLARGELDLVIGTQALFAAAVRFAALGLVIVDEQHRFGVEQRAALHRKGEHPDMLVMTATPIPRSLALTCFGELDLTVIDERPPGRQPASTYLAGPEQRQRVLCYLERRLVEGRQAVVIAPRIDADGSSELVTASDCMERLRRHPQLGRRRLDLLHGRLAPAEQLDVLERLRAGRIDVLVATTIVEVGLDVPGLGVVVVEHPERFGLGQLHQLRGRVGRDRRRGECILQLSEQTPPAARQRLQRFARTRDGFQVATLDLETRGVGELLGRRQHGLEGLEIADLARDRHLLLGARRAAQQLLDLDPRLEGHPALARALGRRRFLRERTASCISYGDALTG